MDRLSRAALALLAMAVLPHPASAQLGVLRRARSVADAARQAKGAKEFGEQWHEVVNTPSPKRGTSPVTLTSPGLDSAVYHLRASEMPRAPMYVPKHGSKAERSADTETENLGDYTTAGAGYMMVGAAALASDSLPADFAGRAPRRAAG